jgi:Haem-binding domain
MFKHLAIVLLAALSAGLAKAHEGHHHEAPATPPSPEKTAIFRAIDADFNEHLRPVIERACYDCHSDKTRLPWYHAIPGVGWMIDRDIAKGRRHMDFSIGFPFGKHGTPEENLKAIGEEVEEGEMPPTLYRFAHSEGTLTPAEVKTVEDWVKRSQTALAGK